MAQEENSVVWKDRKHWLWFPFSLTVYSIEDDRQLIKSGLLSTQVEETLLYRIRDCLQLKSTMLAMPGRGSIRRQMSGSCTLMMIMLLRVVTGMVARMVGACTAFLSGHRLIVLNCVIT